MNGDNFVQKFSAILVKQKSITQERADELKHLFAGRSQIAFDEFLLTEGFVDRADLLKALSEYYQVPSFDATGYFFDQHLVQMFPQDVMVRNLFIPLEQDQNMLIVVANNPDNPELLRIIGNYVSYDIRFNVCLAQDIIDAVRQYSEYAVTQGPEMIDVDLKKEHEEENEVRNLILEEEEED